MYKSAKGVDTPKALFKELQRCKKPLRAVATLHNLAQGESETVTGFTLRIKECVKSLSGHSKSRKGTRRFNKTCLESEM